MTPDDVVALRRLADHAEPHDVRALCAALEKAWAERDALPVVLNVDYRQKYLNERDRAERAEAVAQGAMDDTVELNRTVRMWRDRAERAETVIDAARAFVADQHGVTLGDLDDALRALEGPADD